MRIFALTLAFAYLLALSVSAVAIESCPNHPGAIGTSRTIAVDPKIFPQIGTLQYRGSLPLQDHEVGGLPQCP